MTEQTPSATTIVDTSELRWFADGSAPAEVIEWFAGPGSMAVVEDRCDTYRIDQREDSGLKRRFRRTLELKVRLSTDPVLALETGLAAPVEHWRRWSPADQEVDLDTPETWIDVFKTVYKRRFVGAGTEIPWSKILPVGADVGCDVEITSVRVADIEAWTFALAAFGPLEQREDALRLAWVTITRPEQPPKSFTPSLRLTCGYPEWLNHTPLEGRRLRPEGSTRLDATPERDSVDLV